MKLIHGDCLEEMSEDYDTFDDNSIDAIVTDPPYGIGLMGKAWDTFKPGRSTVGDHKKTNERSPSMHAGQYDKSLRGALEFYLFSHSWAKEALRILKPGGHMLSSCSPRMYHRMVCGFEDAGFEVRDCILWCFGSGFPKSMDPHKKDSRCPEGWGTALKPAFEPFVLVRKPLSEKTVAENVLKWGTGGINIDGCRVDIADRKEYENNARGRTERLQSNEQNVYSEIVIPKEIKTDRGRFPANLIHDGSEEVEAVFPETKSGAIKAGQSAGRDMRAGDADHNRIGGRPVQPVNVPASSGSASRFFYCAKASKSDRNEGLASFQAKQKIYNGKSGQASKDMKGVEKKFSTQPQKNIHPTVKPCSLMKYLVKLICPPGGTVLDPFMGSGSTGKACKLEGFDFIGIEREAEYMEIAKARIENAKGDDQISML